MKLIDQDDNIFKIQRDDGQIIDVAKKGLSESKANYFAGLGSIEPEIAPTSNINAEAVANTEYVDPKSGVVIPATPQIEPVREPVSVETQPEQVTNEPIDINGFAIKQPAQAKQDISSPMEDYKNAALDEANKESEGHKEKTSLYGDMLKEQNRIDAEYEEKEKQLEAEKLQAESDYKEVSDDYLNSKEIDQGRYWSNASTGQKITAGIGLIFASLNPQAMQMALASMDKAVSRDIDAQKLEIFKKKEKMGEAKGLVASFNAKFKNLNAAEQAAKLATLEKTKIKMEIAANKTKSQTMQSKARQAIAQVEQSMINTKAKLDKELGKKLSNEAGKTVAQSASALRAIDDMKKALFVDNDNTFSLIGENNYTLARNLFIEYLGRLQSGGAINSDEKESFLGLMPSVTDSKAIQKKKFEKLEADLRQRIELLGVNPDDAKANDMSGNDRKHGIKRK